MKINHTNRTLCAALILLVILTSGCAPSQSKPVDIASLEAAMLGSQTDLKRVNSVHDGEDMFAYLSDMSYDKIAGYFFAYSGAGEAHEVAVIAVRNSSDAVEAERSLRAHIEKRVASFTAYKPEQVEAARDALVFTSGCYAVMIMGGDKQAMQAAFTAAVSGG